MENRGSNFEPACGSRKLFEKGRGSSTAFSTQEGLLKFGGISDAACNAVVSQSLSTGEKFLVGKKKRFKSTSVPSLLQSQRNALARIKWAVAWGKGKKANWRSSGGSRQDHFFWQLCLYMPS